MGNKIGRWRHVVDDRYTRPQGLYQQHRDIDHKKLRKLILDSKLAPCYPGDDDCSSLDLEECPICFLYYPSLNCSRCCMKGICTECFLQLKPPYSTRPTQCPFCKTSNYAVEYRGVRSKKEKGIEQVEEQKVIEAQIRMRQQELQDAEERSQKRRDLSLSSRIINAGEVEYQDLSNNTAPSFRYSAQGNDIVSSHGSFSVPTSRQPLHSRRNREDDFGLDLEEIMVMEAIWLSVQEGNVPRNSACGGSELADNSYPVEASPSSGLACTVAALAGCCNTTGDLVFETLQHSSSSVTVREKRSVQNYPSERWIEVTPESRRATVEGLEEGEWSAEVAEATETGYTSSYVAAGPLIPFPEGGVNMAAGNLLPESFEEQMMLAMTVSLAEVRSRTSPQPQGVTWM